MESQIASKRALPPKFNASGNPFLPPDAYNNKLSNKTLKEATTTRREEKKKYANKFRRHKRKNKKNLYETAIHSELLNSM